MSRWDYGGWYKPTPKRAPPKHGIKVKKTGSTWWGQRWTEALERMSAGYSSRLARGRTYARAGRTHDLVVEPGRVTAKVTGSSSQPYAIVIAITKLSDTAWRKTIEAMAKKAQFAAELLAGQMPRAIDEAFRAGGVSLFPVKAADLKTACSCPDWANPCKHVAATHYVLGEAFDRDPFLLFELRGRAKAQVLADLRVARGGDIDRHSVQAADAEPEIPRVTLGTLTAVTYEQPPEPLPVLHFSFAPPAAGGVLRQLGTPGPWSIEASPVDLFGPLVRAAGERARLLALAEPAEDREDERPAKRKPARRRATK